VRILGLLKADRDSEAGVLPSRELIQKMGTFMEEVARAGVLVATDGLQPSSKGKRVRLSEGKVSVIDGPFTESKELIAGYWLWQVKSLEEAIEWLKRCPNPHPGSEPEVEIRPLFEASDFGQ
jgi:hypothetical protein